MTTTSHQGGLEPPPQPQSSEQENLGAAGIASFDLHLFICIFEVLPDEFLKMGPALKPNPASLSVSGSSRPSPDPDRLAVITAAARRGSEAGVGDAGVHIWTDDTQPEK